METLINFVMNDDQNYGAKWKNMKHREKYKRVSHGLGIFK